MKKYFSFIVAVATMFAVTSCSQEEVVGNENSADAVEATFNVGFEGSTDSRAISDGTTVDQLYFAVYDADGKEIKALRQDDVNGNAVKVENKTATVKVRLVKGQTYSFVFWAQKSEMGHYNTDDMKAIKVNSYAVDANDETRDAFYAYYDMKGEKVEKGFFSKDIVLKRPFAQLNLGTTLRDWIWATTAEVTIAKSKVKVTGAVYNTLNTFTGEVSNSSDAADAADFKLCLIPDMATEKLVLKKGSENSDKTVFEQYYYLSSNYLLAPAEKELSKELVFTLVDEKDVEINTLKVINAPLQQNWRTNIVGDILTGEGTFNIVIDPTFDDERNYWMEDNELVLPGDEDGSAINNGVLSDLLNTTLPESNILEYAPLIENINFTGTFTMDEPKALHFKNVSFETLKAEETMTILFENVKFTSPVTFPNTSYIFIHNCYMGETKITSSNVNSYIKSANGMVQFI